VRAGALRAHDTREPTNPGAAVRCPSRGSESRSRPNVVYAIGTNANPIIGRPRLKLNKRGYIATDESFATSIRACSPAATSSPRRHREEAMGRVVGRRAA